MENAKQLMENEKIEYNKKIELMQSKICNVNVLINEKDELIEQLKIKHQNLKNSIINSNNPVTLNQNNNNNNELKIKLEEMENIIQEKNEKINELNYIIENNKKGVSKEMSIAKKLFYNIRTI